MVCMDHHPTACPATLTPPADSCTVWSRQPKPDLHPVLGLRCSLSPRLFPDAHDLVQQTPRSDYLHTGLGLPDIPNDARGRHRV